MSSKNTPSMFFEMLRRNKRIQGIERYQNEFNHRRRVNAIGGETNYDKTNTATARGIPHFINCSYRDMDGYSCCAVCTKDMIYNDGYSGKLLCGHIFHIECIRLRLPQRQTCPICRFGTSMSFLFCSYNKQIPNKYLNNLIAHILNWRNIVLSGTSQTIHRRKNYIGTQKHMVMLQKNVMVLFMCHLLVR